MLYWRSACQLTPSLTDHRRSLRPQSSLHNCKRSCPNKGQVSRTSFPGSQGVGTYSRRRGHKSSTSSWGGSSQGWTRGRYGDQEEINYWTIFVQWITIGPAPTKPDQGPYPSPLNWPSGKETACRGSTKQGNKWCARENAPSALGWDHILRIDEWSLACYSRRHWSGLFIAGRAQLVAHLYPR